MEKTYEFTAQNAETLYGFGTESEATTYLRWLNRNRKIDLYQMATSDLTDAQADVLAINLMDDLALLGLIP